MFLASPGIVSGVAAQGVAGAANVSRVAAGAVANAAAAEAPKQTPNTAAVTAVATAAAVAVTQAPTAFGLPAAAAAAPVFLSTFAPQVMVAVVVGGCAAAWRQATSSKAAEERTSAFKSRRGGDVMMISKETVIPTKQVWVAFGEAPAPGEIVSGFEYDQEIAIVNDGGTLYAVSNKLPPFGQPATFGKLVGKGELQEAVTGTVFNLKDGRPVGKWCPGPIPVIFGLITSATNVEVYKCRKKGSKVEVNINVNAKAQFEQKYWRGVLDSQGKVDGGYY
jgi:nitrite reductase/ring-hydroxylating ferredoxin subunit